MWSRSRRAVAMVVCVIGLLCSSSTAIGRCFLLALFISWQQSSNEVWLSLRTHQTHEGWSIIIMQQHGSPQTLSHQLSHLRWHQWPCGTCGASAPTALSACPTRRRWRGRGRMGKVSDQTCLDFSHQLLHPRRVCMCVNMRSLRTLPATRVQGGGEVYHKRHNS